MEYFKAPQEWKYTDRNPFTEDGAYGWEWSCFCLLDSEGDQFYTGKSGSGLFSARFGRGVKNLEHRLVDFLRYENAQGRKVMLSFPDDVDIDAYVRQALLRAPEERSVRPDDPRVVVHSTTSDAWKSILKDRELKAASQLALKRSGTGEPSEVELYYRNEPPEYKDYIMFGDVDSPASEMVLASVAKGRFVMSEDAEYQPGVRLYFDNHRLIADGLGVRDGLHLVKVRTSLPLEPYLLAAVTVEDVDPEGTVEVWTLRKFVEASNAFFRQRAK